MVDAVLVTDVTPRAGPWLNLLDAFLPSVPGVQVGRLEATYSGRVERVAVAFPDPLDPIKDPEGVATMIHRALPDVEVGCVLSNDTGHVTLWVPPAAGRTGIAFIVAAGAAVLQSSWSWDESEEIAVATAAKVWRFRVSYEGNGLHVARAQGAA